MPPTPYRKEVDKINRRIKTAIILSSILFLLFTGRIIWWLVDPSIRPDVPQAEEKQTLKEDPQDTGKESGEEPRESYKQTQKERETGQDETEEEPDGEEAATLFEEWIQGNGTEERESRIFSNFQSAWKDGMKGKGRFRIETFFEEGKAWYRTVYESM